MSMGDGQVPQPEASEPDIRYTVNLGLLGPTYEKATDRPLTKGRYTFYLLEQYES